MAYAATLFFDVGGVLLTNGWDEAARRYAAEHFHIDFDEFQERHRVRQRALETAGITLEQYLREVIFDRERPFTLGEFRAFMEQQSQELPGSLDFIRALAAAGRYRLCVLNNESAELNEYRICTFRLNEIFGDFFSSCYLKTVKPEPEIYRTALAITRCPPKRAIFVDDRPSNVAAAVALGLDGIVFRAVPQLQADLARRGVTVEDPAN